MIFIFNDQCIGSRHRQEDAHECVEEYHWIESQPFPVSRQKGLEQFSVCAGNEPNSSSSQDEVDEE
jgi:hypothetical protein